MEKRGHTLTMLYPLGLLAVYALLAAGVILLAAEGFRSSQTRADREFGCTTALAYVTEKLRSGDRQDAVRVDSLEGCPALVISLDREGAGYDTYIYCYDGYLRELMVRREVTPAPRMGRALLELESLSPTWAGEGLLRLECGLQGDTLTRYVNLKAGEGYPCG